MAKFIDLGTAIVNTNFIMRVEMASNGRAEIYMSDGTMFPCNHFNISDLCETSTHLSNQK